MVLPQNANVYYAVNTAFNLNFILRVKSHASPAQPPKPHRTKNNKKTQLAPS